MHFSITNGIYLEFFGQSFPQLHKINVHNLWRKNHDFLKKKSGCLLLTKYGGNPAFIFQKTNQNRFFLKLFIELFFNRIFFYLQQLFISLILIV
jgi:hypothetical protein